MSEPFDTFDRALEERARAAQARENRAVGLAIALQHAVAGGLVLDAWTARALEEYQAADRALDDAVRAQDDANKATAAHLAHLARHAKGA